MPTRLKPAERTLWQRYVSFANLSASKCSTMSAELERAAAKAENEPVPIATETLSAASDDYVAMVDNFTREADEIRTSGGAAATSCAAMHAAAMAVIGNLR